VAGSDGAPVLLPSLLSSTSPNGYRNTALEVWYLRLRPRYIDRIFTAEISRTATGVLGKGDCTEGRGGRNMSFSSMTTRPILTNRFGLRRVFIRLMKSLWLEQTTDINLSNSRRSLALVKESIQFTMGVNKFQKLYVIKNLHPCMSG